MSKNDQRDGAAKIIPYPGGFHHQTRSKKSAKTIGAATVHHMRDRDPNNLDRISDEIVPEMNSLAEDRCDYERRKVECQEDVARVRAGQMARTALRRKYKDEASNHSNMLQRAGKANVDPRWHDFVEFLGDLGPRPADQHSPDRLNNDDPEYGPGKVAWRDKRAQANNRSNTITLTYGNETLPLADWARRTNQKPDTLRARRRKSWSDEWVIFGEGGKAAKNAKPVTPLHWPGANNGAIWEERFQAANTDRCRLTWWRGYLRSTLRQLSAQIEPYEPGWEEGDPYAPSELPPDPPHIDAARKRRDALHQCWGMMLELSAQVDRGTLANRAFWLGKNESHEREQRRDAYWARRRAESDRGEDRCLDGFDYPPGWEDAASGE